MKVLKSSFHNMMTMLIALMLHALSNINLHLMKKKGIQVNLIGATFKNVQFFVTSSLKDEKKGFKSDLILTLIVFFVLFSLVLVSLRDTGSVYLARGGISFLGVL